MNFFVIMNSLLLLPTTQFNMKELNMLELINISSKKNLTVGAYAFRTSLQANRLLMSSPRGLPDQTLTFMLASWASLIFTSQLEGSVGMSGISPLENLT